MFKIEFAKDKREFGIEVSRYVVDLEEPATIAYEEAGHIETKQFDKLYIDGKLRYSVVREAEKKQEAVLNTPIDNLGLSIRARNCLYRDGYRTLGEVMTIKDIEILNRIRNLGHRSRDEILNKVREYDPDWLKDEKSEV